MMISASGVDGGAMRGQDGAGGGFAVQLMSVIMMRMMRRRVERGGGGGRHPGSDRGYRRTRGGRGRRRFAGEESQQLVAPEVAPASTALLHPHHQICNGEEEGC